MLQPTGATMTWIAGLYRVEDGLPVFVILTRPAAGENRSVHDQIPLMLQETVFNEWIKPETRPESLLRNAITELIFEKADEEMLRNSKPQYDWS